MRSALRARLRSFSAASRALVRGPSFTGDRNVSNGMDSQARPACCPWNAKARARMRRPTAAQWALPPHPSLQRTAFGNTQRAWSVSQPGCRLNARRSDTKAAVTAGRAQRGMRVTTATCVFRISLKGGDRGGSGCSKGVTGNPGCPHGPLSGRWGPTVVGG